MLIKSQNILERFAPSQNQDHNSNSSLAPPGSSVWLVQIPSKAGTNLSYFKQIFKDTHLRLDSFVFAFLQDKGGKFWKIPVIKDSNCSENFKATMSDH